MHLSICEARKPMISNLIFYGSNLGLGFVFSFYFWDKDERNKGLIVAAIFIPILWTVILAAGKGTMNLIELYNYEKMNFGSSRNINRVTFWMVPMFWATFAFGCIWVEKNQFKNEG